MRFENMGSGSTPEKGEKLSVRDALVQSGIAERMLESIKKYKGILDPEITFGVEDCDFRVKQIKDLQTQEVHTQVIIEMPNLHPENSKMQPRVMQAFRAEEGKSFGAADEAPLTPEQWGTIQKILQEQKSLEQKKQELITKLASLLHDEWRAPRKQEDGSFNPRIKKTKDKEWIKGHGTDEVDIANTPYAELPKDWQSENKAAAEVAISEVLTAVESGRELDDAFIEEASSLIHDKWLERNGEWAPEEQKKPFGELSEEEKEKDRAQVRKAIEIFESSK